MLLQLREALYQLSTIRSTVLIASGHFATPVHMIDHLQKKTAAEQLALDEVLRLLLNPAKIQFDYGLMISSFGFPDVNLSDIDLEWM